MNTWRPARACVCVCENRLADVGLLCRLLVKFVSTPQACDELSLAIVSFDALLLARSALSRISHLRWKLSIFSRRAASETRSRRRRRRRRRRGSGTSRETTSGNIVGLLFLSSQAKLVKFLRFLNVAVRLRRRRIST